MTETLPALAELKREGLVRHIGITGLPLRAFRTVLDRCPRLRPCKPPPCRSCARNGCIRVSAIEGLHVE